jgi:hypothetical protein
MSVTASPALDAAPSSGTMTSASAPAVASPAPSRSPTICTTSLAYAPLEDDGRCLVTLIADHRVIDGAQAARALERLEQVLAGRMAEELAGLAAVVARPREARGLEKHRQPRARLPAVDPVAGNVAEQERPVAFHPHRPLGPLEAAGENLDHGVPGHEFIEARIEPLDRSDRGQEV